MQLQGAIPFAVFLLATASWAISVVRDSDRRDTRTLSALFACAGLWALLDLFAQLTRDPAAARLWLGLVHVPALLLGPLALSLLARVRPPLAEELGRWIRLGFGWACGLGAVALWIPDRILGVSRSSWGDWMPVVGSGAAFLGLLGSLPALAALLWALREGGGRGGSEAVRSGRGFAGALGGCLLVAFATELGLPIAGIETPRLGALSVLIATGIVWLGLLRGWGELVHSPNSMARAVLAELCDGVALVELDGTILSANARLAELTGRRGSTLAGMRLDRIARVSVADLRRGLDEESILHREGAEPLPVALSSSVARDRRGGPIGAVVVFRDLREVDLLRRHIVTSGRLAALGELAAGIAHEVNNPTAFMRADLNLLKRRIRELEEKLAKDPELAGGELAIFDRGPERVERALESIERIAEVVGDVREFAHLGAGGTGGSEPQAVLQSALRLARLERRDDVEFRVRTEESLDRVPAGQDLKQVLLMLLRLLATHAERKGRIEVEMSRQCERLRVGMRASPLDEPAASLVGCLEQCERDREASACGAFGGDLGVGILFDLVEQMRGTLELDAEGERALRVDLRLPFESGAGA